MISNASISNDRGDHRLMSVLKSRSEPELCSTTQSAESVAILIDYENVASVGFDAVWNVVQEISQTEHVGIVRAYGNWHRLPKARKLFESKCVIPTHMPGSPGKNSADIQMATDAISIAYEKSAIKLSLIHI